MSPVRAALRAPLGLALLLLLVLLASDASAVDYRMRVLVLSGTQTSSNHLAAVRGLTARGIPFDVFAPGAVAPAALRASDGTALYYALVRVSSNDADATVDAFLADYRVPEVVIVSVAGAGASAACVSGTFTSSASSLRWLAPALDAAAPGHGVNTSSAIDLEAGNLPRYPATLLPPAPGAACTVVAQFADASVAALLVTGPVRQSLVFFFTQTTDSVLSTASSHVWTQFLTRGIYIGQRRVFFSPQVDDVLLRSDVWSPATLSISPTQTARMTPADMDALSAFSDALRALLPPGSFFNFIMWVNGAGGFQYDGGDLLEATKSVFGNFWWGTHSWAHEDFNVLPYAAVATSLALNQAFAVAEWGIDRPPASADWLPHSMCTPGISGLANPEALRALLDADIEFVTGDTSTPTLNVANPYYALYAPYTSPTGSRVLIVPRNPTSVPYFCYNATCMTSWYNTVYSPLTFDGIMAFEQRRTFLNLGQLLWGGYMFHQENAIGGAGSLLATWASRVVEFYTRYLTLPLVTLRLEDLGAEYVSRQARDACGDFGATMSVDGVTGNIAAVRVPTSACASPARLTFPAGALSVPAPLSTELYGPDATVRALSSSAASFAALTAISFSGVTGGTPTLPPTPPPPPTSVAPTPPPPPPTTPPSTPSGVAFASLPALVPLPTTAGPVFSTAEVSVSGDSLVIRFTSYNAFNLDGSPAFPFSRTNFFFDLDGSAATGYSPAPGVGSELLLQGTGVYLQTPSEFNAGFIGEVTTSAVSGSVYTLSVPRSLLLAAVPTATRVTVWGLNDEINQFIPVAGDRTLTVPLA